MAFIPTFGHGVSASLSHHSTSLRCSTFHGARPVVARSLRATPAKTAPTPVMKWEISDGVEFDSNPLVFVLAVVGWVVPSSIPSDIPLLGGQGLSQAFFASVQSNLANFPKGPALDDPFWVLFALWHVG